MLLKNSTPAERLRGCSFAENFVSEAEIILNGGTITGNPAIDFGADLDGTNDYITYALTGNEFDSAEISIEVEFYPNFEANDGVAHYIFDATSGSGYTILKRPSAQSNRLDIVLGGTVIANIAIATYQSYWNVNARNIITISGTTADTSVWLNGNAILSNDNTAWSLATPTNFYVGSAFNGTGKFDGKISRVRIFKSLLTSQEHTDSYNNATYNYMNESSIDLQMRAEDNDPTNTRTLDVSGNDNHATINGATKLTKKGFNFDGGDYLELGNQAQPAGSFSVVLMAKSTVNAGAEYVIEHGSTGANFLLANLAGVWSFYVGALGGGNRSYSDTTLKAGSINTFVGVWDGTNTTLYVNGVAMAVATTPLAPSGGTVSMEIGKRVDVASNYFTGDVYEYEYFDGEALTPLQVADLHLRMLKQINTV